MQKVAIVIVNWNTGELLARCLESLADLPEEERDLIDEVYVVDNASSDGSMGKAKLVVGQRGNEPRVRFVQEKRNLGFAAGNNVAFERIRERAEQMPHVLLLNPDTEVRTGALPALLAVLERRERAGIVGPQLLNTDGSTQESLRQFPTLRTFSLFMLKLGRLADYGSFDYGQEQEVDQVMGSAFLIRDVLFEQLGDLDAGFWVWFEEVDYCKRAQNAGWQVWYTPTGQMVHHGGVSFGQLVGWRKAVPWLRSSLRYARKHLSPGAVWVLYVLAPVSLLLTIPASGYHVWQRWRIRRALRHHVKIT